MPRSFFFLFLLEACAATHAVTKANDYYCLATGATWVYDAEFLGKKERRAVVMGRESAGFWVDDNGGKLAYDGEGLRDERRYLLKQPLVAGAKWTSMTAVGSAEHYEILSVGQRCQTATLHFSDCVAVRSTMRTTEGNVLENDLTFAREVGLVKVKTTLLKGEEREPQVAMELVEFHRP